MLHGEGNEKGKNNNNNNKTKQNKTIGLKQKKKTFPLAAHGFFYIFCSCFRLLQRESSYTSYPFYRGNVT